MLHHLGFHQRRWRRYPQDRCPTSAKRLRLEIEQDQPGDRAVRHADPATICGVAGLHQQCRPMSVPAPQRFLYALMRQRGHGKPACLMPGRDTPWQGRGRQPLVLGHSLPPGLVDAFCQDQLVNLTGGARACCLFTLLTAGSIGMCLTSLRLTNTLGLIPTCRCSGIGSVGRHPRHPDQSTNTT